MPLLRSLYVGQRARVKSGLHPKEFGISQGLKQGDPVSALLFIAVTQDVWKITDEVDTDKRKKKGTLFGHTRAELVRPHADKLEVCRRCFTYRLLKATCLFLGCAPLWLEVECGQDKSHDMGPLQAWLM